MSNVTLNIEFLQKEYPKTWKDFDDFQQTLISSKPELKTLSFASLPYEWQLGVFLSYFSGSGIEIDISNAGLENAPSLIQEAFLLQENNISHYS